MKEKSVVSGGTGGLAWREAMEASDTLFLTASKGGTEREEKREGERGTERGREREREIFQLIKNAENKLIKRSNTFFD